MRNWYKYFISNKKIEDNLNDRFVFNNYQLIVKNQNTGQFDFNNFKNKETFFKQFNFLKEELDSKKETLFIGSSWGESEFFLRDKFKLIASDIEDKYVDFHKKKNDLKYIKLDILNIGNLNKKFDQVVVNNIEYLFDDVQLEKCINNIYKISNPNAKVFVIFRSRDSFIQTIIDNFLIPLETFIIYLIKKIFWKKNLYFKRGHHGFRRNISRFVAFWKNKNFLYEKIYEDMYVTEFERLQIFKLTKISIILSKLKFKNIPYLNILVFKKLAD